MSDSTVAHQPIPRLYQFVMQLVWVLLAILALAVMATALPIQFNQLIRDAAANRVILRNIGLSANQYAFLR